MAGLGGWATTIRRRCLLHAVCEGSSRQRLNGSWSAQLGVRGALPVHEVEPEVSKSLLCAGGLPTRSEEVDGFFPIKDLKPLDPPNAADAEAEELSIVGAALAMVRWSR